MRVRGRSTSRPQLAAVVVVPIVLGRGLSRVARHPERPAGRAAHREHPAERGGARTRVVTGLRSGRAEECGEHGGGPIRGADAAALAGDEHHRHSTRPRRPRVRSRACPARGGSRVRAPRASGQTLSARDAAHFECGRGLGRGGEASQTLGGLLGLAPASPLRDAFEPEEARQRDRQTEQVHPSGLPHPNAQGGECDRPQQRARPSSTSLLRAGRRRGTCMVPRRRSARCCRASAGRCRAPVRSGRR